jgi:2-octaprenyl-6-methoxyphenol hydroxylase
MTTAADVAVIGAGPAGLMAAVALAGAGVSTALVAGPSRPTDNRTTALLASSVTALETIGVWQLCESNAAPLRAVRIVDDTRRLWRAPEAMFSAAEIGLETFGWNIENRYLVSALSKRAREFTNLVWIDENASTIEIAKQHVTVALGGGQTILARLVVGADGHKSLCRTAAGITTTNWSYPQAAVTFNINHSRPHRDVSTEFHTETGPFTLVPLPGLRSSVVAVLAPREAKALAVANAANLAQELERRCHSILGKITVEPGHGMFALAGQTARSFAANRVVLVGEAGHVMPPIGAQGLNLGLRDAATIGELVAEAARSGADIGAAAVIDHYQRARRADVTSRTLAVDLLNRSLLSGFLPAQGARGLSLYMLDRIGPLKRALMREGAMPTTSQPRLMRGQAL